MANLSVSVSYNVHSAITATSDEAIRVKTAANSSRNFCFSKLICGMTKKRGSITTTANTAGSGSDSQLSFSFGSTDFQTEQAASGEVVGVKTASNSSRNLWFSKLLWGMAKKRGSITTQSTPANAAGSSSDSQLSFSFGSIDFRTEQDLFSGINKAVEVGALPLKVSLGMEELYLTYRNAVCKSGHPKAYDIALSNTALAFQCIFTDMKDCFKFTPYHRAIREPFDYYRFGQNYIRPLIDFRNSYVGNISVFHEIQEKLNKGENIILISNHQTEADPAVISLLLESTNPYLSENMTYVAGDRVITDPLCKPFSMGRNLICVYSKKHMYDDPELVQMKKNANIRSLKELASLLKNGSQIIWVAPSGGRDRPHPKTQECHPARFDTSVVDNMRRLLKNARVPGHLYPVALLCYDIMPPPFKVEKAIGEKRIMSFHGVGLSIGHQVQFLDIVSSQGPQEANVEAYTNAMNKSVNHQYMVLKSAIYDQKGLEASTADVSLSQPF